MKAADIMTTDVVTIDDWVSIADAARTMQWNKVKTLIVNRASEDDAYGIITQTDIAKAIANSLKPDTTYVREVMTKPCIVVNPDLATKQIVKLFIRANIRVAPVIKDRLLGIISLSDLLTKTNCLNLMGDELAKQKILNLKDEPNHYPEYEWDTDDDATFQNWCSG